MERSDLYRVAERIQIEDAVQALSAEVKSFFRTNRGAWPVSTGKAVLAVCRQVSDSFLWSTVIHGSDMAGSSVEDFEESFLSFVLDRNECSVIRVSIHASLPVSSSAWLYVRGEDQEEAARNLLADSVMSS